MVKRRLILFYCLSLLCLITDQWSKAYVFKKLNFNYDTGRSTIIDLTFINKFLSFECTINTGTSWSMFSDFNGVLMVGTAFACVGILVFAHFIKNRHVWLYTAMGLVLGGAIGNWLDRPFYGGVRDFIRTDFIEFPIFNLADTWITIGATLIIIYLVFESKFEPHLQAEKPEDVPTSEPEPMRTIPEDNIAT